MVWIRRTLPPSDLVGLSYSARTFMMASTSTAIPRGSVLVPMAERAWYPRSPKTCIYVCMLYVCMHHRRMAKAFSCCHATTLHTHCMCAACQLHTQCMRKATYTVVRGLGCALLCLPVCLSVFLYHEV